MAPFSAYPHLNDVRAVPIVHIEAWHLAGFAPLLWRSTQEGLELTMVVTRSLVASTPPKVPRPRIAAAYPFAAGQVQEMESTGANLVVMWDRPPEPLEPGLKMEPIFDMTGGFTPEAQRRIEALTIFAAARDRTKALTQVLIEQDLLQAWTGHIVFGGVSRPLIGGWRIADDWLDRLDRDSVLADDLMPLFEVIEAHLISLRHPDLQPGALKP